MPSKAKPNTKLLKSARPSRDDVQTVLASLERVSSAKVREDMSTRYGIHTKKAFGVMMRDMQKIAKSIGVNHELALALWDAGLVRGPYGCVDDRRSGEGHGRTNGPMVQDLRQLGHLRYGLLQTVRPHPTRLDQGDAVEQQA